MRVTWLDWTWLLTVSIGLEGYLKLERHPGWFTLISLLALLLKNSVKDNKISIHENEGSDITITISSLEATTAIHISFLTLAAIRNASKAILSLMKEICKPFLCAQFKNRGNTLHNNSACFLQAHLFNCQRQVYNRYYGLFPIEHIF